MKKVQLSKLNSDTQKPSKKQKKKPGSCMPIVECSCGAKILLVPDLAAMEKAIKTHMTMHKGADEQFLIGQVLNAASKQTLPEF